LFAFNQDLVVTTASVFSLNDGVFAFLAGVNRIGDTRLVYIDGTFTFVDSCLAIDQFFDLAILFWGAFSDAFVHFCLAFCARHQVASFTFAAWVGTGFFVSGPACPFLATAFHHFIGLNCLLTRFVAPQLLFGLVLGHALVNLFANIAFDPADCFPHALFCLYFNDDWFLRSDHFMALIALFYFWFGNLESGTFRWYASFSSAR